MTEVNTISKKHVKLNCHNGEQIQALKEMDCQTVQGLRADC